MGLKKTELYRGFNIFTEEVRAGAWRVALVELPAGDGGGRSRTPEHGRLPGEHPSKASALTALPEDYTVCYRRLFPGRRHIQEPDFVVIGADIGLVVLEVKDWRGPQPPV
jgi:hypothetical protein